MESVVVVAMVPGGLIVGVKSCNLIIIKKKRTSNYKRVLNG